MLQKLRQALASGVASLADAIPPPPWERHNAGTWGHHFGPALAVVPHEPPKTSGTATRPAISAARLLGFTSINSDPPVVISVEGSQSRLADALVQEAPSVARAASVLIRGAGTSAVLQDAAGVPITMSPTGGERATGTGVTEPAEAGGGVGLRVVHPDSAADMEPGLRSAALDTRAKLEWGIDLNPRDSRDSTLRLLTRDAGKGEDDPRLVSLSLSASWSERAFVDVLSVTIQQFCA
jgi:hypothetical protein